MDFTTLITCEELSTHLDDPDWAVFDCRFTLGNAERGLQDYLQGHIPGAIYAHLEDDLCGPIIPGVTGRHPLPPVDQIAQKFSSWGLDSNVQVVAYDDWPQVGLPVAARLWWMLRWLGHENVAVLDGGWIKWIADRLPTQTTVGRRSARKFNPEVRLDYLADSDDVNRIRLNPGYRLFDSRSADRYRGENETIDPVAGHIPGALSLPFASTVNPQGTFLSRQELRDHFGGEISELPADKVVFYCGSGVTAAVNVLAMAHAGLGDARLYVGSWSEWITDPSRPVA
jgi:thiosulfate/3-mercaptopyruvate sulfurtransferase